LKTPPKIFELKKDIHKANCLVYITQNVPVDEEKPHQIIIYTSKEIRSLKQNRLYWKHMGEIEKFGLGDLHMVLKRKFLHPIYMKSNNKAAVNYQTNFNALCIIKKAQIDIDFDILFESLLTTTIATTKQMAEYINAYWSFINQKGCYLTDPETYMTGEHDGPNSYED